MPSGRMRARDGGLTEMMVIDDISGRARQVPPAGSKRKHTFLHEWVRDERYLIIFFILQIFQHELSAFTCRQTLFRCFSARVKAARPQAFRVRGGCRITSFSKEDALRLRLLHCARRQQMTRQPRAPSKMIRAFQRTQQSHDHISLPGLLPRGYICRRRQDCSSLRRALLALLSPPTRACHGALAYRVKIFDYDEMTCRLPRIDRRFLTLRAATLAQPAITFGTSTGHFGHFCRASRRLGLSRTHALTCAIAAGKITPHAYDYYYYATTLRGISDAPMIFTGLHYAAATVMRRAHESRLFSAYATAAARSRAGLPFSAR